MCLNFVQYTKVSDKMAHKNDKTQIRLQSDQSLHCLPFHEAV